MHRVLALISDILIILCRKHYYDSMFSPIDSSKKPLYFWIVSILGELIVAACAILFADSRSVFRMIFFILLNLLIYYLSSLFYYTEHFKIRFLISSSLLAINILGEFISGTLLSLLLPGFANLNEIQQDSYVIVLSNIINYLLISVICFLRRKKRETISLQHILLTCITPICSILFIFLLPYEIIVYGNSSSRIFLLLIIILLLNIANLILINSMARQTQLEEMIRSQKKQLNYQSDKFSQLSNAYKETRRIVHEVKRYNSYITSCVHNKEYDKILSFIQNSNRELEERFIKINTGNLVIDTFLTNYDTMAHERNIDYSATIKIDKDDIPVNDYDLCILLGNLLDNSFNAAESWKNVHSTYNGFKIEIRVLTQEKFFVIHIANTVSSDENKSAKEKNELLHGYGTINVKKIVEKYSGIYFQSEENNQYKTTLSIPIIRNSNGIMIAQPEYNQDIVPPPAKSRKVP